MSPDENSWKIFDYAWAAVGGLGMIVWNMLNGKINQNNEAVYARIKDTNAELDLQRAHIAKLFDKLEAHGQRSEDRHHELLTAIHTGLDRKADK